MKIKRNFLHKIFSSFSAVILLLNSFIPYLPAVSVSASEPLKSDITFNTSIYSFELSVNSSERLTYLLSYRTPDNTVGTAPSDVEKSDNNFYKEIYAGIKSGPDSRKDTILLFLHS